MAMSSGFNRTVDFALWAGVGITLVIGLFTHFLRITCVMLGCQRVDGSPSRHHQSFLSFRTQQKKQKNQRFKPCAVCWVTL